MSLHITDSGLVQNWSLSFSEFDLVNGKFVSAQLGFSCQFKFFTSFGYFAETATDIPKEALTYLAEQLGFDDINLGAYDFLGRSGRRHRTEIIKFLGYRRITKSDRNTLASWISAELCPGNSSVAEMIDQVFIWCRDQKIYWSSRKEAGRLVRSERQRFLDRYLNQIVGRLSPEGIELMDESLSSPENETGFHAIKSDPGQATLDNVISVTERLAFIQKLKLPNDLLSKPGTNWIEIIVRRVGNETASEMRRHSIERRLGFYSVYLMSREAQIIDGLADLLIETIHKISIKSRRKVISGITRDIEKVYGKEQLLVDIADAAIQNSSGSVLDVIFPVASEEKLAAIIKEHRAKGTLDLRIYEVMRNSYANHYRRMLPHLLAVLEFRSNNTIWRPVLQALDWIKREVNNSGRFVPVHEIPIEDVIPKKWRSAVIGIDGHVNRISYELCILQQLRDRIRSKEIWIVGANRHRNPDEDLPQDFETKRDSYYANLNLTRDARAFTNSIKADLERELRLLNAEIPGNKKVRIKWQGKNRVSITPFEPLPEPIGLVGIKAEIGRRWPMLSLLDILKETALDTDFLRAFETSASRVALSPETLDYRLILTLYGLGTNAGLKRIAAGCGGVSYDELLRINKQFINASSLREACARVANATLGIRNKMVWGETGTACASDSKKFGAWDQNLMTEWHVRYGGRGVMIYWHVDKGSTCIYSQLKRCSSSEVGSMIEGVLRHCTDKDIQRQYVDSHGQSVVGFAFCHLLGFELAPRLKAIARQKLALPSALLQTELQNIQPILSKVINWKEIEQQYDEMVKYAAAMKDRIADPEAILRRFTRSDVTHTTYKALSELGRAIKTIFLCRYLRHEQFRREINEGLNVFENWNSANGFVFFGKGGEIMTNRPKD